MAAITGTTVVPAPQVAPMASGLYAVADVQSASGHEINGVTFETELGFDVNLIADNTITCIGTATKTFDEGLEFEEGLPFTLYSGVLCKMFQGDDFEAKAVSRLQAAEERGVEKYIWENLFADRGVDLTPAGGAVSPTIGLGLLEEFAGTHYAGKPTVHVGRRGAVSFNHANLISDNGGTAGTETKTGSDFANGAGYISLDGPSTAADGEVWAYITGRVSIRRGDVGSFTVDQPTTNNRIALAERTFVPTVDMIVGAVLIALE